MSFCKWTIVVVSIMWLGSSAAFAQFALNFQGHPDTSHVDYLERLNCNFSSTVSCRRGQELPGQEDPDTTPIIQETFRAANNNMYYHTIIGDPASDFVYEFYIRAGWGTWDSWGNFQNASDGTFNGGTDFNANNATWYDPLHATMAGSGTGSPNNTQFRLKITDNGFAQDTRKAILNRKPTISQQLNQDGVESNFVTDMSALSYADNTTVAPTINTMRVSNTITNEIYTDFDISTADVVEIPEHFGSASATRDINVTLNSGRYTYGNAIPIKNSSGDYFYYDGGAIDPHDFEWSLYWDDVTNIPNF